MGPWRLLERLAEAGALPAAGPRHLQARHGADELPEQPPAEADERDAAAARSATFEATSSASDANDDLKPSSAWKPSTAQ